MKTIEAIVLGTIFGGAAGVLAYWILLMFSR